MLEQVRISNGAHMARVHRKWLPCDTKIVEAWIGERFPYSGETWKQFCERVLSCRGRIETRQARDNILVITSATPIAIWTRVSLEILDERVMRLAALCTMPLTPSLVCGRTNFACLLSMRLLTSTVVERARTAEAADIELQG